jgi:hypothetical protein
LYPRWPANIGIRKKRRWVPDPASLAKNEVRIEEGAPGVLCSTMQKMNTTDEEGRADATPCWEICDN